MQTDNEEGGMSKLIGYVVKQIADVLTKNAASNKNLVKVLQDGTTECYCCCRTKREGWIIELLPKT